jgi:hypothetical protein
MGTMAKAEWLVNRAELDHWEADYREHPQLAYWSQPTFSEPDGQN